MKLQDGVFLIEIYFSSIFIVSFLIKIRFISDLTFRQQNQILLDTEGVTVVGTYARK